MTTSVVILVGDFERTTDGTRMARGVTLGGDGAGHGTSELDPLPN